MAQPAITPLTLRDFDSPEPQHEEQPARFSQEDIDKASADAFEAGMRAAKDAFDKSHQQTLQQIADRISSAKIEVEDAIRTEKNALSERADQFLRDVCKRLCVRYEAKTIQGLLTRLLTDSDNRTPAILQVSADTQSRLTSEVAAVIEKCGASDFVSLAIDPSLAPGECRLEWRGGSLSHTLAPYDQAIETFVCIANPDKNDITTPTEKAS